MKKFKNIFKKMSTQENETVNEKTNPEMNGESAEKQEGPVIDEKDQKIAELQAKADELNDKYLRLYSEFDNFRKRTAKEKIELIQTGGEDVFKSVLPVIDDFERAIKSNNETTDVKAVNDGVNLIYSKLKSALTQKGLEEMKSLGETFNADIHEAITNIPAPTEEEKGKVLDELEKGYTLNGKIIRFAKVIIGS
jgi:molecular chaperone GrpE